MLSSDHNHFEEIRQRAMQELRHIGLGPVVWGVIGRFLELVRASDYWKQEGANSFTEWVHSLARVPPCSPATLWRYHAAARSFERLSGTLAKLKMRSGRLESLPPSVSPENIELLSKLARVAPQDVLEPLAQHVLAGTITRDELRRTWQTFRPALAGRTARGRGSAIPRIDQKDSKQYESVLEGIVLNALDVSGPSWTGCKMPVLYRLFLQVTPDPDPGHLFLPSRFDVIAVLRREPATPLELHAVECVGTFQDAAHVRMLSFAAHYCDYVWVASHPEAGSLHGIPKGVGVLKVESNRMVRGRAATRTKNPTHRAAMLAALIGRGFGG